METLTIEILKQIFQIAGVVLASGVVTSLLTQALKWRFIAVPASKYPIPVAAVLSLLISAGAVLSLDLVVITSWISWLVIAGASLLVATQSYDLVHETIKKSRDEANK